MTHKRRHHIIEYEGENYYYLLDPYTELKIDGYLISKNGRLISKKRSKTDSYYKRVVYKRKSARNCLNLRYNEIPIERYMDELVAYNFLKYDKSLFDIYWIGDGEPHYRNYNKPYNYYIIHLNGDISDDTLDNLQYVDYSTYIEHCKRFKRKPIIKDIDKQIMIDIDKEDNITRTRISELFHISPSGLSRILNKEKRIKI